MFIYLLFYLFIYFAMRCPRSLCWWP